MFRLFVLVLLLTLAIIEYIKPMKKFVFPITFSALTLMLALRGGQGTDYFSYCRIYIHHDSPEYHHEPGFNFVSEIFRNLNLPYTVFVFCFSVTIMVLLYFIVTKACENKFMALFTVYALYYLQFFENGVRQAMAMMLVLLGFILAAKKQKIWYTLFFPLLGFMFHTSGIVGLIFILPYISVKWKSLDNLIRKRSVIFSVLFAFVCVSLLYISQWQKLWNYLSLLPENLYARIEPYITTPTFSPMALMSRLAFLAVIVVLYIGCNGKLSDMNRMLFRGYLIGILLYCALFRSELVSSRFNAYLKVIEIVLIPNLIGHFTLKNILKPLFVSRLAEKKRWLDMSVKACVVIVTVGLLGFMYLKTTKDVMGQSKYNNPGYIYPYFTVFNMKDMYSFREAPGYVYEEYYAMMEREQPQQIGFNDSFSDTYFPLLSSPYKISTFRTVPEALSPSGSVVSLLELENTDNIYSEKDYVEIKEKDTYKEDHYRRVKDLLEDRK
ncbi:MAG: EpsG family protein [Ruminococcaceae bacterium]|nr:EpsG family protein [Oscillospiraceae bacterium]